MHKTNKQNRLKNFASFFCSIAMEMLFPKTKEEKLLEALTVEDMRGSLALIQVHNCTALLTYRDPHIQSALRLLKYYGNRYAAKLFGVMVGEYILETLPRKRYFAQSGAPLLIPLPLSRARKNRRGFNQIERIAQHVEKTCNGAVVLETKGLKKIRHTKPQTKLGRKERLTNVEGSFKADIDIVKDQNIILLDDIVTTGSTMKEARKALRNAGAKRVWCIAIAS